MRYGHLGGGEVVAERVVCTGPVPADQADADRAAVVAGDMRADLSLRTARRALAVEKPISQ
jgi:hypothetical protein